MKLLALLKAEPVATMAVVSAANGVLILFGVPKEPLGAVSILIGAILAFPVRSGVAPLQHVVQTANVAAEAAAKGVAEQLTPETVGGRGEITGAALGIATETAGNAADQALRQLGVSRKDRAA